MKYILITGCAGFIGFHTCLKFLKLKKNISILGIDNLNNYYDVSLKKSRLNIIKKYQNFTFKKIDISNKNKLNKLFENFNIYAVIHLAAQAGVRYSLNNRSKYFKSNVIGFYNILECSKEFKIKHLIFSSTSSVYGNHNKIPYKEDMKTDKPTSFYAATKKMGEIMAYPYSHLYKLNITCVRLFTVYGPYGRPDMALFKFVKAMIDGNKITLYNRGNHIRDFTYIDDVTDSIYAILIKNIRLKNKIPYKIVNIGRGKPENLLNYLKVISKFFVNKPKVKYSSMQEGDVKETFASVKLLIKEFKTKPKINIEYGISEFIKWYKSYHNK